MSVPCECRVLSRRGLYNGPVFRPEESNRVCVCACIIQRDQAHEYPLVYSEYVKEVRLRNKEKI